jgi:hypothetical protein
MIDFLLPTYNLNLMYAQKLAGDVPEDKMCAQPVAGRVMNHPAFLLGHLTWASDSAAGLLGAQGGHAADWRELFGMGAKPLADRSQYPAKADLLKALEDAHARLSAAVSEATPEMLAQPAPERMRSRFATLGQMIHGLMTAHEATHLGQFSAWRRAIGLPSVF